MNGIYDFENYRTPYLDTDMLMEYKAKKQEKRLIAMTFLAVVLMVLLFGLMLYHVAVANKEMFVVAYGIFTLYVIIGAVVVGTIVRKKRDCLWALQ